MKIIDYLFINSFFLSLQEVRVNAIAEHLAESNYELISLQEGWSEYDFNRIR
mgnify:CR=1 FL=1